MGKFFSQNNNKDLKNENKIFIYKFYKIFVYIIMKVILLIKLRISRREKKPLITSLKGSKRIFFLFWKMDFLK